VRRLTEERTSAALRRAGTGGGSLPFTGRADVAQGGFAATEGLAEVAFVPQPDPRPGHEGRLVLWRALLSPIGGKESLFAIALRDEGGLDGATLEPLAENVLAFSIAFVDGSVSDVAASGEAGGALLLWDSTRGLLPQGEGHAGFRHARGKASIADPDDDLFPDAVRIAVVVAPPPGEAPVATTLGDVPAGSGVARVDLMNGRFLAKLGAGPLALKIGHEWVEAAPTDGTMLLLVKRGLLGTAATAHPAGSKVLVGRRFERVVPLPASRADLVSRELRRDPR
jgi:hypothetical protein